MVRTTGRRLWRHPDGAPPCAAPGACSDTHYREELFAAVVACAKESLQRLRPGRMEVLRTRVPQVHYNRRPRLPDGSVRSNLLYPTDGAAELRALALAAGQLRLPPRDRRPISATASRILERIGSRLAGWRQQRSTE